MPFPLMAAAWFDTTDADVDADADAGGAAGLALEVGGARRVAEGTEEADTRGITGVI